MLGLALYITTAGSLIKKENTFYFENKNGKRPIPIEKIHEIYILAPINISSQVIVELGKRGILLHYFDYYHHYKGTFYPKETLLAGEIIVKQVEHYLDKEKRLYLAREFISGALSNIKSNLRSFKLPIPDEIDNSLNALKDAKDIHQLMSYEANARKSYYKILDTKLGEFALEGRSRRPPKNEGNALLSFLNSLTYAAVLTQLYYTQLTPTVSYLHEPYYRRFSLALDIAEVFKPLVAERVMVYLIGKKIIKTSDFVSESKGLVLENKALQRVIQEYKSRLDETIKHPKLKRQVSYKQLMRLEGYKLVKHFMGQENYKSFKAPW